MKVIKLVHVSGSGGYMIFDAAKPSGLLGEIELIASEDEVGEEWGIHVEEMTEQDFENLPEHMGW